MEQSDHLADAVLTARALDHPSPENYFRQKDVRYQPVVKVGVLMRYKYGFKTSNKYGDGQA
jgi:hypothetical protein